MLKLILTFATLSLLSAAAWAQPQQRPQAPKVGEEAPNFTVTSLDGAETFELRAFREKKPVVLFFGSYT